MKTYRMLLDNEEEWRGKAHDAEHAEERCFYDESPVAGGRYTLQRWGRKKITRSITSEGWITEYENENLASV